MTRTLRGEPLELGGGPPDDLVHLGLLLAERPADRDPLAGAGGDGRARLDPQLLIHPALDDPVDRLLGGPVLFVPAQAPLEPAVRALHRAGGVLPRDVEGR